MPKPEWNHPSQPEAHARAQIDGQLIASGWAVQDQEDQRADTMTPNSFSGDRMRRIDRYCPPHPPYKKFSALGSFDASVVSTYTTAIITHLRTKKSVTLSESHYLYFLGRILKHQGADRMSASLQEAASYCRVTHLEPFDISGNGPSLNIPGLGKVTKANWRFLPNPESLSAAELIEILKLHFSQHAGGSSIIFDIQRIEFALSLTPEQICVGSDEFAGYYAFVFGGNDVLFECPAYGNAAYVVRGDWRILSQQYKAQLEKKGTRIVHGARSWKTKIKRALRTA